MTCTKSCISTRLILTALMSMVVLMLMVICTDAVSAQNGGSHLRWKTDAAFREALASPASVNWEEAPLKSSLERLGSAYGVCVVLDRRIDPGRIVNFECQNTSLAELLKQLAGELDLAVCPIGSVVYVGPPPTVERLPAIIKMRQNEVLKLPASQQVPYMRREPMSWNDLDSPRDITVKMIESSGLKLFEPQRIPHDLWPGANLPPMNLVDRLTLLGAGFHQTFIISPDGRQIAMTAISDDVSTTSGSTLGTTGGSVVSNRPPSDGGNSSAAADLPPIHLRRLTANVKNKPFKEVLENLCGQLHLNLSVDWKRLEAAGVDPDQFITFSTENATVDQLLSAILESTECSFRRNGSDVQILPPVE